ncbi:unnamed protein product [Citrullus colocynthis]|uniref:F-box associated beta-propeller type 1 domain-containing protein n=1 Tax=Citrullus colocynthis TaxID=252529 RepID=A0ABP0Y8V0_9ROSI
MKLNSPSPIIPSHPHPSLTTSIFNVLLINIRCHISTAILTAYFASPFSHAIFFSVIPSLEISANYPPPLFTSMDNHASAITFDIDVYFYPNAIGFGYDSKSKDFKVVRVVNYVDPASDFLPPRAEVYHLEKDRWREIKTPIYGRAHQGSFEIYYQGFYYWWADSIVDELCPKEGRPKILWRFNMSEEVFDNISVPYLKDNWSYYVGMGVLNGSIVLLNYTNPRDERSFDVWRMDSKDGEVLWSKLFTVGPVLGAPTPLGFVSSDQLLMEDKEG